MAPPPLAELTARAQTLTSAGDLAGARRMLATALNPADAENPRLANPDLALAAALHARILIALGDPHAARLWAGFAHAAEERLHGPHDERTVAAAATHAAVLQQVGHYGRAAQVYHRLVGDLTEIDGAESPRVLAAEADLSTAEHAGGDCTAARARLTDAWRRSARRHGESAPAGIKMLARLGAMERECGREAESHDHLSRARQLCTRHLPTDHPLVRQVAALAAASSSGRHVCGRVQQSTGPQEPPGATAVDPPGVTTVDPPGVHRPGRPAAFSPQPAAFSAEPAAYPAEPTAISGEPAAYPAEPAALSREPAAYPSEPTAISGEPAAYPAGPETFPAGSPADDGFPPDDLFWPRPDEQPPPDNRPTDPNGAVYQQPLYLSDVYRAPGDLTARHARADTPPPLPGQRAPDYGPDGRSEPRGIAPTGTLALPPNSERVRSAELQRAQLETALPEVAAPRRRQPFLLAAVVVAAIAAVAAVVALTLPDADGSVGPTAAAPTSAASTVTSAAPVEEKTSVPAAAPGAPQRVRLQDNRDSVALRWIYPKAAEGPVLVSGGRAGQQPRVFQQLSAGSAEYIVYGLNETQNYCFTVAVAYSADRIAGSAPVCTTR
ncbi:MAG TPA: fibronectin type III domain-containing protein [Actinoplanes sp.]